MTKEISIYLWDLRFCALHKVVANKLYHQKRAAIFLLRERISMLITLVGSTGALFFTDQTAWWLGLLAFSGIAASLVFRWSDRARSAAVTMVQYMSIQSDIERSGERGFTEVDINFWKAQMASINEPAPNRILWLKSVNEAAKSLGVAEELELNFWQKNTPVIFIS